MNALPPEERAKWAAAAIEYRAEQKHSAPCLASMSEGLTEPPPSAPLHQLRVIIPPVKFTPTPFKWRDPSTFPRRQFVYGRHYARQFLSVTAAPTKVGKSSLGLVEAVAMASGRNLLGVEPVRPMRVWYWNGEDPQEELERRVLAICLHYSIDRDEVEKNLFLDSGRDTEIIIATQTRDRSRHRYPR